MADIFQAAVCFYYLFQTLPYSDTMADMWLYVLIIYFRHYQIQSQWQMTVECFDYLFQTLPDSVTMADLYKTAVCSDYYVSSL